MIQFLKSFLPIAISVLPGILWYLLFPHETDKYVPESLQRSSTETGGHAKVSHVALDVTVSADKFSLSPRRIDESVRPGR